MTAIQLTVSELTDASEILGRVAELGEGWHAEHPLANPAAEMMLHMQLIRTYLHDLAAGIAEGRSVEDAAVHMISGERELSPEAQAILSRMRRLSTN